MIAVKKYIIFKYKYLLKNVYGYKNYKKLTFYKKLSFFKKLKNSKTQFFEIKNPVSMQDIIK
jgi:hypothetical protein